MANYKDKFSGKFLKVDDLRGQRRVATIARVVEETIGQGADAEDKLVVYFREDGIKPLILNRINAESVAELSGADDTDDWTGARIELYPSRTEFQGKRVPCIRIQAPAVPAAARAAAESGADLTSEL
jgi:hypothetical protein